MNTKLFLFAIFATILLSACVKADDSDDYPLSTDPNDDFPFLELLKPTVDDDEKEEESTDDAEVIEDEEDKEDEQDAEEKVVAKENDEDIPENERIHEGGFVADGKPHSFLMQKCEFIELDLQKRAVRVDADNILGLHSIMVTETPFKECDDIADFDCPQGFCKIQKVEDGGEPIELGSEACDVEMLYLYPIPITTSSTGAINFMLKVTMGDELECDASSQVSVTKTDGTDTKTTETSSESSENEAANTEEGPNGLEHPAVRLLGLTTVTLFTLFVVIVCFYRCQFRKNGEGPFTPPSFCPGFLFPRQKMSCFTAIPVERRQELMDYEPPVPVL